MPSSRAGGGRYSPSTDALSGRVRLDDDHVVAARTVKAVERLEPVALAPGEGIEAYEDPATVD